uniref:Uncharacterized protein n=1 Tax=Anopheles funestus TaxID=62324 RepID=A0A4Y0BVN2_ANOFN
MLSRVGYQDSFRRLCSATAAGLSLIIKSSSATACSSRNRPCKDNTNKESIIFVIIQQKTFHHIHRYRAVCCKAHS